MSMEIEDRALEILNALAPMSRKDEWWLTDGPVAVIARELRRMYPPSRQTTLVDYGQQMGKQLGSGGPAWQQQAVSGFVR